MYDGVFSAISMTFMSIRRGDFCFFWLVVMEEVLWKRNYALETPSLSKKNFKEDSLVLEFMQAL